MGTYGSSTENSQKISKELGINEDILCRIDLLKSLQESFECRRCGECCKQESVAFTEKDILRVAHRKSLSPSQFIDKYDLSLINNSGDLIFYRLTIGKIGVCPFCSEHECTIYDARPEVCRGFPFLTPENVQNAFKMNNVIKLGGNCKAAIDQVKGVLTINEEAKRSP
jgi:Fe-S-cluster containining protein